MYVHNHAIHPRAFISMCTSALTYTSAQMPKHRCLGLGKQCAGSQ